LAGKKVLNEMTGAIFANSTMRVRLAVAEGPVGQSRAGNVRFAMLSRLERGIDLALQPSGEDSLLICCRLEDRQ
jgi:hypothetical protein